VGESDRIEELEGQVAELEARLRTIAKIMRAELGIDMPDVIAS
jgi:hypothetical protein